MTPAPALPPALLRRIVRWSIPERDREEMTDELDALYREQRAARGSLRATLWYAGETLRLATRLGAHRRFRATVGSIPSETRIIIRSLVRARSYALGVIITVALAAGVLTAVYCAANWVLFRPVPAVTAPANVATLRLVMHNAPPTVSFMVSDPDLVTLGQRVTEFSSLAGVSPFDVDIAVGNDTPRRVPGEMVSVNFFRTLGTRLIAGRSFTDEQALDGAGSVAVVSWDLARTLAVTPANVVGTTLRINGHTVQVIGVTEPGFRGAELPGVPMLWVPLGALTILDPTEASSKPALSDRGHLVWRRMIGRIASPGDVARRANDVMNEVRREFRINSYPANDFTFEATYGAGLDPAVRESSRHTLTLLLGAAGLLLLLGVANIASLVATRAIRMEGSLTIRATLGATRARLSRMLLIEALVLGGVGGVAALGVTAAWLAFFAHAQLAERGGSLEGVTIDGRVGLVAVALGVVSLLLAYARPLHGARHALAGRAWRVSPARSRSGQYLVATQVAISVTLLVAATLLARTVHNLRSVDLGFRVDRLLTAAFDPWVHGYSLDRVGQTATLIESELRSRPGVVSAGVITPVPLGSWYVTAALATDTTRTGRPAVGAGYYVTPGLLDAIGVSPVAGERPWRADSGTIAITLSMLQIAFPGVPPQAVIGRQVRVFGKELARIAAVLPDVRLSNLVRPAPPTVFFPIGHAIPGEALTVVARSASSPMALAPVIAEEVASRTSGIPVYHVRTARSAVDLQFSARRIMASVSLQLSGLGLILAMIGLYGVLANSVAARQRDLAIRQALGATSWKTARAVAALTLAPTAFGAAVGMIGAVVAGRLLKTQLFGLSAGDATSYAVVLGLIAIMTAVASAGPVRRAVKVDPAGALRGE